MKRGRIAGWPTVALLVCGSLLAALSGCSSSRSGMRQHADCPMCKLSKESHAYHPEAGPPPGYRDPADCVIEYHQKQTARNAWRARNVKSSMY